jgi:hypothetical protein
MPPKKTIAVTNHLHFAHPGSNFGIIIESRLETNNTNHVRPTVRVRSVGDLLEYVLLTIMLFGSCRTQVLAGRRGPETLMPKRSLFFSIDSSSL